jgi:glutathione S-transferase
VNELVKIKRETNAEKAQELNEKLYSEVIPSNMKLFEAKLTSNNTGYLVGDGLTWVDLYLYVVLEWLSDKRESILEHFPHSRALTEKVANHERIAEWIKKRPVTAL